MELGAASSSVNVIVSEFTVRPLDVPPTVTVSSVSSNASSVGLSVNVPVPLVAPAAIETSKADTGAKSTAPAVPLPDTLTRTVLASANRVAPSTVAVTVRVVAPVGLVHAVVVHHQGDGSRRRVVVGQRDRVRVSPSGRSTRRSP